MAYDTKKEPYVRNIPNAEPEALVPYLDEEFRKIEISLQRIHQIIEEIDTRLTSGGH